MKSSDDCGIKFLAWFFIMILFFPMSFLDLYYGYTDNTCVSEQVGKLVINLKDYLLVHGWIIMCILGLLSILLYYIDFDSLEDIVKKKDSLCELFMPIIIALVVLFLTIWNIFGAIVFWGVMNTTECSKTIYNYVFASLIIKLVFNVICIFENNNKVNDK